MQAVRCTQCGETRWTLFKRGLERMLARGCESCGAAVAPERRRPGTPAAARDRERRRARPGPGAGTG